MYPVNDIFDSIQGEGYLTGKPATFIRLQGCPVMCPWCDTNDSWNPLRGAKMSAVYIATRVQYPLVVITGGEPLIHDLDDLLAALDDMCVSVQVETCGAFPWLGEERPDYLTVSPKEKVDFNIVVDPDEIKFVVDEAFTTCIAQEIMGAFPNAVFSFMPEGSPPTMESRQRAMTFAMTLSDGGDTMYSERVQYILGVK